MRITRHPKAHHTNVNVHFGAGQPTPAPREDPRRRPFLAKAAARPALRQLLLTEITPGSANRDSPGCKDSYSWNPKTKQSPGSKNVWESGDSVFCNQSKEKIYCICPS